MKKLASFLAAFFLSCTLANAQFTIDQITQFGNSADQVPAGMSISNGSLYIAGSDAGQSMVLKYGVNNITNLVWNIKWPGASSVSELFGGVAADADGVYVSGYSYSQTTDGAGDKEHKPVLCKFPINGATGLGLGGIDWIVKPMFFGYKGYEHYLGNLLLEQQGTSYIYSFGGAESGTGGNITALLTKHDTNGNMKWQSIFGDQSTGIQGYANAMCLLNNNLYIGGCENHFNIWKIDLDGNKIWSKQTESTVPSIMMGICASDNYIYGAGYETIAGKGNQALIIKYDEDGNIIWKKVWGGALEDMANGIEIIDNTLWVVGETSSYGSGGKDAFILKLNATDGSVMDSVFGGGPQDDAALKILKNGQSVYISGTFQGTATFGPMTLTSNGGKDVFLMKMNGGVPPAPSFAGIPVVADANTVILDHFDGTNIGETVGTSAYVQGTNGMSQAIVLSRPGNYIIYSKAVNMEAAGTVEMWVYPKKYAKGLLNINWNYTKSYPPAGHVFHMTLDSLGKVNFGNWGYSISNSFKGNTRIPLNTWTHVAVTWGDSTKLYINGKLDMSSALLCRPAIRTQAYFYLPYWGDSTGYFDEFHVSKIKRTGAEMAARIYTANPDKVYAVTAGNLSSILSSYEKNNLATLKLSGTIDARDFKTMRDSMPMIETIDLSQVNILSYTGTQGPRGTVNTIYPANTIPRNAFYLATEKSKLTTVVQPANITEIGRSAYNKCSGLTNINWPISLTSIGYAAFAYCQNLKSVELPSGVSVIDTSTFLYCSSLKSVTIPSSIKEIRRGAFWECSGLTQINLPNSVTSLGYAAFAYCRNLALVGLPSSISVIDTSTFYDCRSLISITIPSSIKEIRRGAFLGCSELSSVIFAPNSTLTYIGYYAFGICPKITSFTLPPMVNFIGNVAFLGTSTEITVPPGNNSFVTINGVLYDKALTRLMYCPAMKTGRIDIPSTVTSIAVDAFYNCIGLDSITIPPSLQIIENWAFENCTGLRALTIPASVNQIWGYAFYNCSNLKALYVNSVAPIDLSKSDSVFNYINKTTCTLYVLSGLKAQYQAADKWKEFTNIVEFSDAVAVTPGNLYRFFPKEQRAGMKRLSLKGSIDARDFKTMRDSMPQLEYIDLSAVTIASYTGKGGTWNATDFVYLADKIPHGAFNNPNGTIQLNTILLPNNLKIIGRSAFNRCYNLKSVVIGPSVTSIDSLAFISCYSLRSIALPSSITTLQYGAFLRSGLKSVIIPEGVKIIGEYALQSCVDLETISLPATLEYIGFCAITYNNRLKSIEVSTSNPQFSSLDGVLFDKTRKTLVSYPNMKSVYYKVPEGVEAIDTAAFEGCWALRTLELPTTLKKIGLEAFYECSSLSTIEIPASVISIESYAFFNCKNLKIVNARMVSPVNITTSNNLFDGIDKNVCILRVPTGSKFAYQAADKWNTFPSLAEDISKLVTIAAGGLFNALTSIERNEVTHLKVNGALDARDFKTMREYMPLLAEVDLGGASIVAYNGSEGTRSNSMYYKANATPPDAFFFRDRPENLMKRWLTKITLPTSVTEIGDASFTNCGLKTMTLHEGLTTIVGWAFYGCQLSSLALPATLSSIQENAFGANPNMVGYTVAAANPYFMERNGLLYDKAGSTLLYFPNAKSFTALIPNSTEIIQSHAFEGCGSITFLNISSEVKTIVTPAFNGLSNLLMFQVESANGYFSVKDGVLYDKNQKTILSYPNQKGNSFGIPWGVGEIGPYAFFGCWNLNELYFTASVTKISNNAFQYCTNLSRIVLPTSINTIGSEAFSECYNLNAITVNWYNPINLSNSPNVFNGVNKATCVLKVPANTAWNYKNAPQWGEFNFIDELQDVTYNVQVPAGTKACYIAGEMNGWTQQPMTKKFNYLYTITLRAYLSDQYKYCSGPDWSFEELDNSGKVINNRNYSSLDTVRTWRTVYEPWMPYSPWNIQSNPSYSIGKIQFVSATEGWVASGNDNSLLHSTNGGAIWNKVVPFPNDNAGNFSDPAISMDWVNPSHGWAIKTLGTDSTTNYDSPNGAVMYSTFDGGGSWTRKALPKTEPTVSYSDADLQGVWQVHQIFEGNHQDMQSFFSAWAHSKLTVGADGQGITSDNVLSIGSWNGSVVEMHVAPNGDLSMKDSNLKGFLNIDKNTGVFTMTNEIGSNIFGVMQRQVPNVVYQTSDLAGNWQMHMLNVDNPQDASSGNSGWVYAIATVDATGNAQLNMVTNNGDINSANAQFALTTDGFVSIAGMDWHGFMNAEKTAFYSTFTNDGGKSYALCVLQKQKPALTYDLSDLKGSWVFHEILVANTDLINPIGRINAVRMTIQKDGSGKMYGYDNKDNQNDVSFKFAITSSGIVSEASDDLYGFLNADKNTMVFTRNDKAGYALGIMQRDSSYSGDMGLQVQFADENTGWASTYNFQNSAFRLYRSINGGTDWDLLSDNRPVGFFDFVDANNGWVITMPSDSVITPDWSIHRTSDGGLTWTKQYSEPAHDDDKSFNALQFTDLNNGWVAGGNGILLKTVDGGLHWTPVTNSGHTTGIDNTTGTDCKSLFFLNANTGWISVKHYDGKAVEILQTTDGGASWSSLNTNIVDGEVFSLNFWDENHGWFTGEIHDDLSQNNGYVGIIGRLIDGGVEIGSIQSKKDISFYPNPVKDGFYIRSVEPGSMVTIYNLNGSSVLKQRAEADCYVDVKDLKKGMYLVRISSSSGVINKKIVKM